MAYSHVAHDSFLNDNVILSNNVQVGGHVDIENNVIVGGSTPIHHFCKIGEYAFIGGGYRINLSYWIFNIKLVAWEGFEHSTFVLWGQLSFVLWSVLSNIN